MTQFPIFDQGFCAHNFWLSQPFFRNRICILIPAPHRTPAQWASCSRKLPCWWSSRLLTSQRSRNHCPASTGSACGQWSWAIAWTAARCWTSKSPSLPPDLSSIAHSWSSLVIYRTFLPDCLKVRTHPLVWFIWEDSLASTFGHLLRSHLRPAH